MIGLDVVIPVRPGQNEELRFVLRSLTNLHHGAVHILGSAPHWVDRSAVRVVERRRAATKWDTVTAHLAAACTDPEISDPFILLNDDIYITGPVAEVPPLHRGLVLDVLADYGGRGIHSSWIESMRATRRRLLDLTGHEAEPYSYELHVPMVIRKDTMTVAIAAGADVPRWNRRTAYGNLAHLGGHRIDDVKLRTPADPWPAGPFLSTSDASFRFVRPALRRMFPTPSRYERGTR